jgi:hypothetical protein
LNRDLFRRFGVTTAGNPVLVKDEKMGHFLADEERKWGAEWNSLYFLILELDVFMFSEICFVSYFSTKRICFRRERNKDEKGNLLSISPLKTLFASHSTEHSSYLQLRFPPYIPTTLAIQWLEQLSSVNTEVDCTQELNKFCSERRGRSRRLLDK